MGLEMKAHIDWPSLIAPPDFASIYRPPCVLRRWLDCVRTPTGLAFQCQLEGLDEGQAVNEIAVRIDVIYPDVLRLRMNPAANRAGIRQRRSDMLVQQEWPAPDFEVIEHPTGVSLQTGRIRAEFPRSPWRMQVYAGEETPFFRQQTDDRRYGPAYEVPPLGYERSPNGMLSVRECVSVTPGESFYGFGEKFGSLDKFGQELNSWAVDSGNVSSSRSYKNIPFFLSSAGYGLFVHSSYPMIFRMGSQSSISYSIHILDEVLDYFLIYGPSYRQILMRYADLTGRAPIPPKWSFGFWISRAGYKNRAEVEGVVHGMRHRDFPCDVLSIDPWWMGAGPWSTYAWDEDAFPNPGEMMAHLRQQGVRTCLWIHPYLPHGTPLFEEARQNGYLVQGQDGLPCQVAEPFTGASLAAIDFTNPEAAGWFQSKLGELLDMGVAVFKTDFGEQAPVEAVYSDGRSGLEMHNLYPLLYNRTVFELTRRKNGRGLVWGRSAYAGSQRYPVQWGGDSYGSLDQMASQLRGLLSYGMSGVPFCSHDVGGFDYPPAAFHQPDQEGFPLDAELYLRWLQFGVFSSHLRAHGKQAREPWLYGDEAARIARRYLKLRYRLLPYIYSEAVHCAQSGLPMVRPLAIDFQDDLNTRRLDLEYMFGSSLLVAPVVDRQPRRMVYLPEGVWVDFWRKSAQAGGQWISTTAPLETIPVWVKGGTILPLGPEMDYTGQKANDLLTLQIYAPQGANQILIEDEDQPAVRAAYQFVEDRLTVEVAPTPGEVEICLFGWQANQALQDRETIPLRPIPGGQIARLDGRNGVQLHFQG